MDGMADKDLQSVTRCVACAIKYLKLRYVQNGADSSVNRPAPVHRLSSEGTLAVCPELNRFRTRGHRRIVVGVVEGCVLARVPPR